MQTNYKEELEHKLLMAADKDDDSEDAEDDEDEEEEDEDDDGP